jgi:hypothetical protein
LLCFCPAFALVMCVHLMRQGWGLIINFSIWYKWLWNEIYPWKYTRIYCFKNEVIFLIPSFVSFFWTFDVPIYELNCLRIGLWGCQMLTFGFFHIMWHCMTDFCSLCWDAVCCSNDELHKL